MRRCGAHGHSHAGRARGPEFGLAVLADSQFTRVAGWIRGGHGCRLARCGRRRAGFPPQPDPGEDGTVRGSRRAGIDDQKRRRGRDDPDDRDRPGAASRFGRPRKRRRSVRETEESARRDVCLAGLRATRDGAERAVRHLARESRRRVGELWAWRRRESRGPRHRRRSHASGSSDADRREFVRARIAGG